MGINPINLTGNWDEGYVLDQHVLSSVPIGEDVYGHMQFSTTRSELGELLYLFKYKGRYDCLQNIMELVKPFLDSWKALKTVDIILPVPSSKPRSYQPANEIANAISDYLNISVSDEVLKKTTSEQSKNMDRSQKHLEGSIIALKKAIKPHTILLVDDLYSTGETLNECVRVLREDENLKKIYVLAMTKTR